MYVFCTASCMHNVILITQHFTCRSELFWVAFWSLKEKIGQILATAKERISQLGTKQWLETCSDTQRETHGHPVRDIFYKSLSDTPRTYVAPRPRCLHHDDDMFAKFFSYVQIQSTLQCTQHGRKANIYLCTVMHREFSPDTVLIQDIDILFPLSYGRVGWSRNLCRLWSVALIHEHFEILFADKAPLLHMGCRSNSMATPVTKLEEMVKNRLMKIRERHLV